MLTKRLFDISISSLILLILSPIILITWLLIYIIDRHKSIFIQQRPGINGMVFNLYKFRTMKNEYDSENKILPDNIRMTRLGKILRFTSLDELPTLWNVLKGDVSLVGPRPLLVEYLNRYTFEQMRRHEVKPGITGWAQIKATNAITWEEKFKLDVWYVDNQSFWLDVNILLLTLWKVLRREGISQEGNATMEEFRG